MSIHSNLTTAINAANSLSAALQALQADLTGGGPSAGGSFSTIAPAVLVKGDMVTVRGRLYNGNGRVKAVYNEGDRKFKAGQHGPQIVVLAANGKTYRYNGTDIANGSVAFWRKPTGTDIRNFAV